ncbi:MoaD/ThiS family protein [Abyssibius alkaniclasticus]|uniref:MoaD/ThiS family protein n=1 Tax=Abyssibius alkaniclasticus TaxID=2881234 RepID=UPI00236455B3|nr:MoaD/ThiS family protein [Abyssibius alkaniclasticus]UPH72511.1 MoaD/ThiS family protein [Abyssibius alkaniclasticus]|tara:strand:- start:227 stop:496 length:270 start_codon:yes stop_codon:yes gene_type:complete
MATIRFTANLARHRPVPELLASGETLAAALQNALKDDPLLAGYVLDEQGRLRKHVNIFIDGALLADRVKLSDPLQPDAEIYIMQALSGG